MGVIICCILLRENPSKGKSIRGKIHQRENPSEGKSIYGKIHQRENPSEVKSWEGNPQKCNRKGHLRFAEPKLRQGISLWPKPKRFVILGYYKIHEMILVSWEMLMDMCKGWVIIPSTERVRVFKPRVRASPSFCS